MKKKFTKIFFNSLFIVIGSLIGIIVIVIFILGYLSSEYTMNVFETQNENYNIKIIGENDLRGLGVATDVFSYKSKKENKKIGCGALILVGYDSNKGYLYGKSEYAKEKISRDTSNKIVGYDRRGYGIYEDKKKLIEQDIYIEKIEAEGHIYITDEKTEKNIDIKREEKSDKAIEFLKNQCTGYFILNLNTGEYKGGLLDNEQEKILLDKGIKRQEYLVDKFLSLNGKSIKNYKEIENWMMSY